MTYSMKGCCKAETLYCHLKDAKYRVSNANYEVNTTSNTNTNDISNNLNIVDIEACNCDSDKKEQKYFTLNGLTYY